MPLAPIDGYATLLPVLLACLRRTGDPILEFGGGLYSTPLIHAFAVHGRYARTVENDPQWAKMLQASVWRVPSDHHELWTTDYEKTPVDDRVWDVVLIDHSTVRRVPEIARVRPYANLIIVHDTDCPGYQVEPILATFPYRFDHQAVSPTTTVVSDRDSLEWLPSALGTLW